MEQNTGKYVLVRLQWKLSFHGEQMLMKWKKNAWCFQHDVWSSLMRAVFFWCVNNSWIFFCCCCQSIFGWCSFCLKQSNVDRKLFWALKEKNCRIDRIPSDLHKMRILLKCYTNAQNNYKPLRCAKDDENWNTEWTYCCILNGWKKKRKFTVRKKWTVCKSGIWFAYIVEIKSLCISYIKMKTTVLMAS